MVSGFPSRLKQIQLFNPDVVWCLILKLASVPFLYKQVALLYSAESGSSLKQWNLVSVITTSNWYVYFKQSGVWLNLVLSRGDALRQYHKFKERMRLSYRNLRFSNVPGDRLWNENLTNKNSTTQNSPRQYFELPFAHFSEITWRSTQLLVDIAAHANCTTVCQMFWCPKDNWESFQLMTEGSKIALYL